MSQRPLTLILLQKFGRRQNTPENAGTRPFPKSAISGVLRFRVLFGALLEGNKEHPKTQHTRKRRFSERSIICVFGCVAFSGALCSPLKSIAIQMGGVSRYKLVVCIYYTFCQEKGRYFCAKKYRDRNGRCIAILFKSIGVRGRFDAPARCREIWREIFRVPSVAPCG